MFSSEDMFDGIRDAAMVLKAKRRWDVVLDRSARYYQLAFSRGLVKASDVQIGDDYPFRWMFRLQNLSPDHAHLLQRIQWAIFNDFRVMLWKGVECLSGEVIEPLPVKKRARPMDTPVVSQKPLAKVMKISVKGPKQLNKA
jgi:hypothetical protein